MFLKTRIQKSGKLTEQFFVAIAAGIAMVFSTVISFFYQTKFSNFTTTVFAIIVITYIFKDRIKETLRTIFKSIISNIFPDYNTKIFTDNKKLIGNCKETFTFIDENKIEHQIINIRQRDRISDIDNNKMGEKIIFYKKSIKINNKKTLNSFKKYDISGINDILRFNISKFLLKMDNPEKNIYILNNGDYKKISGKRVYHINLILKYFMQDKVLYKKYRLILNRNGLRRIEKVITFG